MDLRQLRYFTVLAEETHFGRAARRLSISQPPLSQAIRQLEEELGARLFDRTSRHVALTPAGTALQREARALLRRAEETRTLVREIAAGRRGRMRVGFAGSMLYRGLAQILDGFRDRAPDIEVVLHELNSAEQAEALRRDEIDLGFVHGRALPDGLAGFRYHAEPFVACLPQTHKAAAARRLRLARLKNDPFVLFSRAVSPDYYESIIATCLSAGFLPRVRHEVRYWLTVVSLVAQGRGVALVPRTLAKSGVAGAAFVPIQGAEAVSQTWCVWAAAGENRDSPALAALVDAVRDCAGRDLA
jgi:DNA-binding transcriptional LysR family regulator